MQSEVRHSCAEDDSTRRSSAHSAKGRRPNAQREERGAWEEFRPVAGVGPFRAGLEHGLDEQRFRGGGLHSGDS